MADPTPPESTEAARAAAGALWTDGPPSWPGVSAVACALDAFARERTAALEAERDEARADRDHFEADWIAAVARVQAAEARLATVEGALRDICDASGDNLPDNHQLVIARMRAAARAALVKL